jgi:hypothetical protein
MSTMGWWGEVCALGNRDARTIATLGVIVVAVGVLAGCTPTSPGPAPASTSSSQEATDAPTDTAAPTEEPAPANAAVTLAGVDVDGQNVTVAGLVTGVIEDGGTCTFVMTSGTSGGVVEATSIGVANVSNTVCPTTQSPIASFSKGPWNVVLDYASDATTLSSAPLILEIP